MIPNETLIGFWIEGRSFQCESEVLSIFEQQVQQTSLELGIEPAYNGFGPWRGYEGPPPARAIHSRYDKAIRFAVWYPETDRELALYLTATDADTWLELTRVTLETPPEPAPESAKRFLNWLSRTNIFRRFQT
jgi:hypothetical protein